MGRAGGRATILAGETSFAAAPMSRTVTTGLSAAPAHEPDDAAVAAAGWVEVLADERTRLVKA